MSYSNYNHTKRRQRIAEPAQFTSDANLWTPTVDQKHMLGCIYDANDGRRWRYCENGSATLALATINQSAVETGGWTYIAQTNTPDVWVAGDRRVTVVTTTTVVANDLVHGTMYVPDGTGEGHMYIIKSNKVGTANAITGFDIVIDIADAGGIRTAIVAASDVTLTKNKYKDVLIFPTNPTGLCVGVNNVAVTADYFFWALVKGPCPVLNGNETIIIGDIVCAGVNTAGTVGLRDVSVADGNVKVGYVMKAPTATGDYALIDLDIE